MPCIALGKPSRRIASSLAGAIKFTTGSQVKYACSRTIHVHGQPVEVVSMSEFIPKMVYNRPGGWQVFRKLFVEKFAYGTDYVIIDQETFILKSRFDTVYSWIETNFSREGVYVIQSGEWFKIGHTSKLIRRLDDVCSGHPDSRLVCFIESSKRRSLERDLHEQYADVRGPGEWFKLEHGHVLDLCEMARERGFDAFT